MEALDFIPVQLWVAWGVMLHLFIGIFLGHWLGNGDPGYILHWAFLWSAGLAAMVILFPVWFPFWLYFQVNDDIEV